MYEGADQKSKLPIHFETEDLSGLQASDTRLIHQGHVGRYVDAIYDDNALRIGNKNNNHQDFSNVRKTLNFTSSTNTEHLTL